MEKIKIDLPIIVEGRYDKSALSGFIDGTIITTGGFSVFNSKEKQLLLRRVGIAPKIGILSLLLLVLQVYTSLSDVKDTSPTNPVVL